MIIANFCKTETYKNLYGLWQWDYGQVLRIQGLPAYLIEGILAGILAEVRSQKNLELISDYNRMKEIKKEEGDE